MEYLNIDLSHSNEKSFGGKVQGPISTTILIFKKNDNCIQSLRNVFIVVKPYYFKSPLVG